MGLVHESLPIAAIYSDPTKLALGASALVGFVSGANAFYKVHQTEVGIRMRGGSPRLKKEYRKKYGHLTKDELDTLEEHRTGDGIYEIKGGGGRFRGVKVVIPFFEQIVKVNIARETTPLEKVEVESREGVQYHIGAAAVWRISTHGDGPYKARFNVRNEKTNKVREDYQELNQNVMWECADGLRQVLDNRPTGEFRELNPTKIAETIREVKQEIFLAAGVELDEILFKAVVRAPEERIGQAIEGDEHPGRLGIRAAIAAAANGGRADLSLVSDDGPSAA